LDAVIQGREQVADWIETTLLARGTKQLGTDELHQLAGDEISAGAPQVSLALGTMKRRADLLGDRYPFLVHDVAVRAVPEAPSQAYSALLLLSAGSAARQVLFPTTSPAMDVLFERIAELALASLWGPEGRSLRFGWPSDIGRPQDFASAVAWLALRLGIQAGAGYRPPRRKDGGVDVVAWRPFPDGRPGFPIVLAQCTLQSELLSKASDVDVRVWASWLVMDVDPVTALVVPQTISTGVLLDQLALRCMVFERLRLAGLIDQGTSILGMSEWTVHTLNALAPYLDGAQS
jgi:hypothetical protein